ncbi:unnamed protein product, partial [Allacma fusca]
MYYPRTSTLDNCGSHFGEEKNLLAKLGIEGIENLSHPWDKVV